MSKLRELFERFIVSQGSKGHLRWMPDKIYLQIMYHFEFGKKLNLNNPQTFNEKLQWLKLYDRRPEYTTMVDKYEAKSYVANIIGEEYIIPTLGVWDHFDDIDFDKLPNQFVLKCTHDSGGLVICKDKSKFDKAAARKKIEMCLKRNFFWTGREWPYKNVKPRVLAEEYLCDNTLNELRDYKVYTFNGEPQFFCINSNRGREGGLKVNYFDMKLNELKFTWGFPPSTKVPKFPQNLQKMIELARKLATNTYQLRVDFYESNGRCFFGELTLFDGAGFTPFDPSNWDKICGDLVKLPKSHMAIAD